MMFKSSVYRLRSNCMQKPETRCVICILKIKILNLKETDKKMLIPLPSLNSSRTEESMTNSFSSSSGYSDILAATRSDKLSSSEPSASPDNKSLRSPKQRFLKSFKTFEFTFHMGTNNLLLLSYFKRLVKIHFVFS